MQLQLIMKIHLQHINWRQFMKKVLKRKLILMKRRNYIKLLLKDFAISKKKIIVIISSTGLDACMKRGLEQNRTSA